MFLVSILFRFVAVAGLFTAAMTDVSERVIPNRVVLLIATAGLSLRILADASTAWISLAAAIGVLLMLAPLARREIIGGGDAKLIPAVTLLLPVHALLSLLLNISLAGGVLSCVYLLARSFEGHGERHDIQGAGRLAPASLGGLLRAERAKIAGGEPMPYAVAILAGATFTILIELAQCSFATSCSS